MKKLIINVALIGNTTSRDKNPNAPITPKEIAEGGCYGTRLPIRGTRRG